MAIIVLGSHLGSGMISDAGKPSIDGKTVLTGTGLPRESLVTGRTTFTPGTYAELLTRTRTRNFILSTQSVAANNATSMDQIYFRLASLQILDPTLSNLTVATRDYWIDQILSFQDTNGGFGGWKHDESSVSNTFNALQSLKWLDNLATVNKTAVKDFLDRLRITLTNGYASNFFDSDSDVYSTYLAVKSYELLDILPVNPSDVAQVFVNAQNLDPDPLVVPVEQYGGFGMQTNSQSAIYWTSEVKVTRAALLGMAALGFSATDNDSAYTFVSGLQSTIHGGFANVYPTSTLPTPVLTGPYTTAALESIYLLDRLPLDTTGAVQYLQALETPDGGFRLEESSNSSSLRGTYYALRGLQLLGSMPSNTTKTIDYLVNYSPDDYGFGGVPGESSSLRETFDAVAALSLAGKPISSVQSIVDYVNSYRRPDGGYGITNSYVDSTSRAVVIHDLLGTPLPSPAETITFIQGLQNPGNGGFVKKTGDTTSYVVSSYRAVVILDLLGSAPGDPEGAKLFFKMSQNKIADGGDGGFGGFPGDTSDVSSTYRAIRALSILGDSSYDINGAKQFLLQSQISDGGFKRSPGDVAAPKNASNTIYTYAAVRALAILNTVPSDVSGLYDYIVNVRNKDGAFAEHHDFTSNIAYTYACSWLLRHLHETSGFTAAIPDDLNSLRTQHDSFNVEISGDLGFFNYTVIDDSTKEVLASGIMPQTGNITVNTASFGEGSYSLRLIVIDRSSAKIEAVFPVLISSTIITTTTTAATTTTTTAATTTTTTSSSSNSSSTPFSSTPAMDVLAGILALLTLSVAVQLFRKRKQRQS
ncbi:MAG: prenyltransferase/squalene oxidase repeat-containing protein [Candidatus Odinarchaeota archaeon]